MTRFQINNTMIKYLYKLFNPGVKKLFLEYKVDLKPRYGYGKPAHQQLHELIDNGRSRYKEILNGMLHYTESLWSIKDSKLETDIMNPAWNNGYLPGLDIFSIYSMIAIYKPKNYIEVGSGTSTKVAYKAKKELGLPTQLISIDPQPRQEIDFLVNKIIRTPVENTDLKIFESLEENDILFIDNSHRILPNSDSMVFFLEILPKLKPGVVIHMHDIYLPFDYPQFMCDRFYSEQYGLAIYLLANPSQVKILLPNYFISEDSELSAVISPIWNHENLSGVERHGGSFWFQIN